MSAKNPVPRELAYDGVRATNPPDVKPAKRNPTTRDFKYPLGTFWLNTVTRVSFQLVDNPGVWVQSSSNVAGPVSTLSGETGAAADPVAGDVLIQGSTNIITSSTSASVVIELNDNVNITTLTADDDIESVNGDIISGGSISAANGVDVDGGDVTIATGDAIVTAGDVLVNGAGASVKLQGAGSFYSIEGGAATDFVGTATLALGTVTVLNTNIAAGDVVLVQRYDVNGSTTLGELAVEISAGVSFTITSRTIGTPGTNQAGDTSIVRYFIVRAT